MKYNIENIVIPQEKRKDINDKCLYIIENGLSALTQSDVFNAYTGDGGLHGLSYDDYDSFHAYTEAKKEIEQGQFFTPHNICKFIVDCIKPSEHDFIADLSMGMGNFFNYLPEESHIYGCDIDIKAYKVAKYLYPSANITADDIRYYDPKVKMDIVFGNPPFNLKWTVGKDEYLSQLYYFIKSNLVLKAGGILAVIVPKSFMNDDFSDSGIVKEINTMFNFICQFNLPNNSFKSVGVDNFDTKTMIFQKQSEHIQNKLFDFNRVNITALTEEQSVIIYNTYVQPIMEQKDKIKGKLLLENLHNSKEDVDFAYSIKKLLYDIKRHPRTKVLYSKCFEYVNQYYTQEKPQSMKWEEWEKVKIKKEQVLVFLNTVLKDQNKVEIDKIELVKTSYGLKMKAYSEKMKQHCNSNYISFNDMVLNENYPFGDMTYYNLYQWKLKEYNSQSVPFNDITEDENISKFLKDLAIHDSENDITIKLNDIQRQDTNKILQKQYGFLQWEQGAGKSISGIANLDYRLKYCNIRNMFIVSTAIAINNTWNVILPNYGYDFIRINNLKDMDNIKQGQIVLVTLNQLSKYQKHIKKYIKKQSQKVALILDESDNISNPDSKRTKAVLNCFRKVRYKTLMTGTSTRNNIVEIYPQLEVLYNNSINMLSECYTIYELDKKENELRETHNEYYMKPIPAYKKGFKLFSESHLPAKITVFGVGQFTQDIYNADILKSLIDKTIITRTFEEVRGQKISEIIQETVKFNPYEKELYRKVIEEFYYMEDLFTSTGNLRKDSMLKILQQLITMIKVCTIPDTYKQYEGDIAASKTVKLLKMLRNWDNEYVAIGCRHIKVVQYYAWYIKKYFPERPLFVITGDKVSLNQRKEIVKQLRETKNGILLSTQQSLSSSVNIGFVDKVIIPELSWNDASMSQYYARFARFDSVLKDDQKKQIVFLTMENSIESNLLQLVMAKEKLNLFMKNQELDDDELYEKYGVDFNLLDMLLSKERDSEGKVRIKWGEQKIS